MKADDRSSSHICVDLLRQPVFHSCSLELPQLKLGPGRQAISSWFFTLRLGKAPCLPPKDCVGSSKLWFPQHAAALLSLGQADHAIQRAAQRSSQRPWLPGWATSSATSTRGSLLKGSRGLNGKLGISYCVCFGLTI